MRQRAQKLEQTPGALLQRSSVRWNACSEASQRVYAIVLSSLGMVCECPASHAGFRLCKHVLALDTRLARIWNRSRKKILIGRIPIRCRRCRSRSFKKHGGRRLRRSGGTRQRYKCRGCGSTFSGTPGFRGRHYGPAVIVVVLSLVACGMSPGQARNHLANSGSGVTRRTIQRWVDHYSGIMEGYARTLRIDAGFRWHTDEIELKINGSKRWLFTVMDGATRTILAYRMSDTKQGVDPRPLFRDAAAAAVRLPRIPVGDGLHAFEAAAKGVFYRRSGPKFVHVREIHLQKQFNCNNVQERLNGELADRPKRIRGLGAEVPGIIRLVIIHHTFFRPHLSLGGRTPASAAHIVMGDGRELDWENWIVFIQNAAMHAGA